MPGYTKSTQPIKLEYLFIQQNLYDKFSSTIDKESIDIQP